MNESSCGMGKCCDMNKMGLVLAVVATAGLAAYFAAGTAADDPELRPIDRDAPGIVDEAPAADELPANAQVVEIDGGGYMAPYEVSIPGSSTPYQMLPISGGTFTMGSPGDEEHRGDDEGPQFEVEVEPFWMGAHHITWEQYHRFMDMYEVFSNLDAEVTDLNRADAITVPTPLYEPSTTYAHGDDPEHPAVTMTQYSARQFTMWLSKLKGRFYRLPTEAEWEYAARAGTETPWWFGEDMDDLDDHAWYFGNSPDGYQHVATMPPNPWGLHDMHGNAADLTMDQYVEDHYQQFADADQPVHFMDVLVWPTEPDPIAVRGGSWDHDPEDTRSAARWQTDDRMWKISDPNRPLSPWWFTEFQGQATGFRLVRPLYQPDEETKLHFWGARPEHLPEAVWIDVKDRLDEGRGRLAPVDDQLREELDVQ